MQCEHVCHLQLREIALGNGGGVASVHVEGFEQLMPIFIGVAEAAALVYATSGEEGRRPSTLGTWRRSLEVCPCIWNPTLLPFYFSAQSWLHHRLYCPYMSAQSRSP